MRYILLDSKNASWVLAAPGMPALIALSNELRRSLVPHWSGAPVYIGRGYADHIIRQWAPYGGMERGVIPGDAVNVTAGAGIEPYYLPDLTFVDYHGLNDWVIARNPVTHPNSERRLAHDRFPPAGYLRERGVNFNVRPATRDSWDAIVFASYAVQFAPGWWMPFDAPSLEWVEARFDSFATAGDLDALVRSNGRLAFSSFFDVYVVSANSAVSGGRRMLVYVKEPCAEKDVRALFFLHPIPENEADLPEDRRQYGFDSLDFSFADRGGRTGERCVATRLLPDYPVVAFRTGQSTKQGRVWEETFSLPDWWMPFDALTSDGRLAVSSFFDIYDVAAADSGGRRALVYVKEPCAEKDARAQFFLHLIPADEADLPEDRRQYGFDNLDFSFAASGGRTGERCVAARLLPDYPVAAVRTGQFTEQGRVWEEEFSLPDGV